MRERIGVMHMLGKSHLRGGAILDCARDTSYAFYASFKGVVVTFIGGSFVAKSTNLWRFLITIIVYIWNYETMSIFS